MLTANLPVNADARECVVVCVGCPARAGYRER